MAADSFDVEAFKKAIQDGSQGTLSGYLDQNPAAWGQKISATEKEKKMTYSVLTRILFKQP